MSNPRILAVYQSSNYIAPDELYQELFHAERLNGLFGSAEQTILIGTQTDAPAIWQDLGIEVVQTPNEQALFQEAITRLDAQSNNFSLNDELDDFVDKWAGGNASETERQKFKTDLRQRAPFLIYYPAMPLFVLPEKESALIKRHIDYLADATFFDNSPGALTPIILAPWFIRHVTEEALGGKTIRDYLLKNLNHIDAELDYLRPDLSLYRLDFSTSAPAALELRQSLAQVFQTSKPSGSADTPLASASLADYSYEKLAEAVTKVGVGLRTTPHYFEIEVTNECDYGCNFCPRQFTENQRGEMPTALFSKIIGEIAQVPGNEKTICLGGLGEPFQHSKWSIICQTLAQHKDQIHRLFIETNGQRLTEETLGLLMTEFGSKLTVIVNLSTLDADNYNKLYAPKGGPQAMAHVLENLKGTARLAGGMNLSAEKIFIVQQLKINEVSEEIDSLRNFFRPKENSASADTFIDDPKLQPGVLLQKYNRYRDLMPERRVSDLTPLERSFCWHLARDMFILADGRYAFCKQDVATPLSDLNLQQETILDAWQRRAGDFQRNFEGELSAEHNCGGCDEWFTFNG